MVRISACGEQCCRLWNQRQLLLTIDRDTQTTADEGSFHQARTLSPKSLVDACVFRQHFRSDRHRGLLLVRSLDFAWRLRYSASSSAPGETYLPPAIRKVPFTHRFLRRGENFCWAWLDQIRRNAHSKRFTRLSTSAPSNAGRKPFILKPGTTAAASFSMSALMTHQNNPKVSIVKGNVTTFRKKPMVPFTRPITTAAINAEPNPLMSKPLMSFATISRLKALSNHVTRRLVMVWHHQTNGLWGSPTRSL